MSTKKAALGTGCGVLANMLQHVVPSTLLAKLNPMLLTVHISWLATSASIHMFADRENLHSR